MTSNRNAIIVVGAFVAIFGWAIMVNALSNLSPTFAGGPVGILQSMTPGFVPGQGQSLTPPTQEGSREVAPGDEGGRKGRGHGHPPPPRGIELRAA